MASPLSDHDSAASLPSPPKQALMDDDFVKTLEQLSKQVRLTINLSLISKISAPRRLGLYMNN